MHVPLLHWFPWNSLAWISEWNAAAKSVKVGSLTFDWTFCVKQKMNHKIAQKSWLMAFSSKVEIIFESSDPPTFELSTSVVDESFCFQSFEFQSSTTKKGTPFHCPFDNSLLVFSDYQTKTRISSEANQTMPFHDKRNLWFPLKFQFYACLFSIFCWGLQTRANLLVKNHH